MIVLFFIKQVDFVSVGKQTHSERMRYWQFSKIEHPNGHFCLPLIVFNSCAALFLIFWIVMDTQGTSPVEYGLYQLFLPSLILDVKRGMSL